MRCVTTKFPLEITSTHVLFLHIFQLFSLLLKTDRVGTKSKTRLRIQETGTYQGLVNMMMGGDVSLSMARHMLDLVLLTDTPASYNAALSIIQLLHGADQAIKLEATKRVSVLSSFTKITVLIK